LPYVSARKKSLTKGYVRETTAGLLFHGRNLLSRGTMFHNKWHVIAQIFILFILPTLMLHVSGVSECNLQFALFCMRLWHSYLIEVMPFTSDVFSVPIYPLLKNVQ
jgi:hypothetical protein